MKVRKTVSMPMSIGGDEDEYVEPGVSWDDFVSGVEAMKRSLPSPNDQPNAAPHVRIVLNDRIVIEWDEEVL
jgi:hypothetical protein